MYAHVDDSNIPDDAANPYIEYYEVIRFEYEGFNYWDGQLEFLNDERDVDETKANLIEGIESVLYEIRD